MKAILEIPAPKSCAECPLEMPEYGYGVKQCIYRGYSCPDDSTDKYKTVRAPFCPLKIVPDEAINEFKSEVTTDGYWIKCSDRLPEEPLRYDGKCYFVAVKMGNRYGTAYMRWFKTIVRGKQVIRWEWNGRISPWEVTHWMPVPEPPEEENNGTFNDVK